jgi:predicted GNAT superfamily acetyltransferase
MIITSRGEAIEDVPVFIFRRRKDYLLRLSRVEVSDNAKGKATAQAFYAPLFRIDRRPGQLIICIWGPKTTIITLAKRKPFFYLEELNDSDQAI